MLRAIVWLLTGSPRNYRLIEDGKLYAVCRDSLTGPECLYVYYNRKQCWVSPDDEDYNRCWMSKEEAETHLKRHTTPYEQNKS